MILQDVPFQYITFFDFIEAGLYFIIVGYYFLLFAYFLFMRFRTSKKLYWLFFSLLFLCLAAGRVFFIAYYFFVPELEGQVTNVEIVGMLMTLYKLATFCTWLGVAMLMGVLGILLFPPETDIDQNISEDKGKSKFNLTNQHRLILRAILIGIPIGIAVAVLFQTNEMFIDPDFITQYDYPVEIIAIQIGTWQYPLGRLLLNFVFLPIFIFIIPFIFLYLAYKTFGVLRRSYLLNGIGTLLYYAGRIAQGVLEAVGLTHTEAVLPPLMILCSLLILVIANNYEQLK